MCRGKIGCSRDSFFGEGYWDTYAYWHVCTNHPAWCGFNGPPPINKVPLPTQEGGVSPLVKRLLPSALRVGNNAKAPVHVYLGLNKSGEPIYVGITNNLKRRSAQHGARFAGGLQAVGKPVTRGEARAIEQALIKNNPGYTNNINSISPNHEYQERAIAWGEAWLRANT
ncbi:MAG: GIY-YIG nuclease family protein [Micromonosporaceae bacterium]